MTKQTSLVTKVKLSEVVKTDAAVDMNSIVAFFISKYENSLLATKKQLSEQITDLNTYLNKEFIELLKTEIKLESFNINIRSLGFKTQAEIQLNQVEFERKKVVYVRITQHEKSKDCSFNMLKTLTVSDELHKIYTDKLAEINALRTELHATLDKLSNIGRKERDVRGALAEKTLRDAGVGDLFEDQTLLDLVSVPTLAMKVVS
ncbi:MAG: hypothetical protein JHC33_12265 [Ignisphaera sp.]|nr:hypothetical protein [Ignisphaera sp.]